MADQKTHKILIVEDNQENIDLLVYFLRPQGYKLIAVNDGVEALKKVEEEAPDLILLDIMLPKMDGFQVCERLKKNRSTMFIPIIMLTALKELKDKIRSLEVGADDFITKPFENIELLARVKSLLRLKDYHDQLELKNQELEQKNESLLRVENFKEELTNLIVHDMKNPLFVIQGNLQMMTMGLEKAQADFLKKYTQRIERSSQQLLRMVLNLIDISRIEDGTIELKRDLTNFNKIVEDVVARLALYPENAAKNIEINLDQEISSLLLDHSIMERVVENLVSFAYNNLPDDGLITITTLKQSDDEIFFSIHDTGIKLPEKFQHKIFEKYSQMEIKNNGYRVSRALGMAFCKLAVEAHQGSMQLEANNPVGNKFLISLKGLSTN
jgi:two-component system sensor histidine kinase/response regulator